MDNYGNTPLHWAAQKNQVESVNFLLSKGANPNLRNISMMAPLHLAVHGMHNEVVKVSWDRGQLSLPGPSGHPQLPGHVSGDSDDHDDKDDEDTVLFLSNGPYLPSIFLRALYVLVFKILIKENYEVRLLLFSFHS